MVGCVRRVRECVRVCMMECAFFREVCDSMCERVCVARYVRSQYSPLKQQVGKLGSYKWRYSIVYLLVHPVGVGCHLSTAPSIDDKVPPLPVQTTSC